MLIGSEGILGVITEAWMRVQDRAACTARRRRCASTRSPPAPRPCARSSQAGLYPSNCRLLDPGEAALTGAGAGGKALLVLGFESADHPSTRGWRGRSSCAATTAAAVPARARRRRGRAARPGAWRDAFLQAPYLRDTLVAAGVIAETFETAITWDRFDGFVATGDGARRRATGIWARAA